MSAPPAATDGGCGPTELLRNATGADGRRLDVRVGGGIVQEAGELAPRPGESTVDLAGWLLLGAFAEPHVHLDKAFTADRAYRDTAGRACNRTGDLAGAMAGYSAVAAALRSADTATRDAARSELRDRAMRALRAFLAAGTTLVRAHTGCGPLSGVAAIEVLAGIRDAVAGTVDLQIVAHAAVPGDPVRGDSRAHRALLRDAVAAGADVIGGNPGIEADPADALAACFEVAADLNRPVDLHVDESADPAMLALPAVAGHAAGHGRPVTAAHCASLGSLPPGEAAAIAELVAAARVDVVTLPATNLYLQGRPGPWHGRRGLTAIDALRLAGVRVAAGADNIRDVFHPLGRCDPLEVAALLVTAGHQTIDDALDMVGSRARAVLGAPPAGPVPGAVADLVALRVDGLSDAVARAPADRLVWRRGRLVARTGTRVEVAL